MPRSRRCLIHTGDFVGDCRVCHAGGEGGSVNASLARQGCQRGDIGLPQLVLSLEEKIVQVPEGERILRARAFGGAVRKDEALPWSRT